MAHALWDHDRHYLKHYSSLIGIDEVGRGAFAGPVVAAGVWLTPAFFKKRALHTLTKNVADSKVLSPSARCAIFQHVLAWQAAGLLRFSIKEAGVEEIETHNILGATILAMKRVLIALGLTPALDHTTLPLFPELENCSLATSQPLILIDGKPLKNFPWRHTGIIKGDSKSLSIALASIIAKVNRDHFMTTLDTIYPVYNFSTHKGYGTPAHQAAIIKSGPSIHHRPSFLKKISTPICQTIEFI